MTRGMLTSKISALPRKFSRRILVVFPLGHDVRIKEESPPALPVQIRLDQVIGNVKTVCDQSEVRTVCQDS